MRPWSLLARARLLMGLGWLAVVVAIGIAAYSAWAVREGYARADAARQLELSNEELLVGMINQETGLRGYTLTADPTFLQPFYEGQAQTESSRADLARRLQGSELSAALERSLTAAALWQAWAVGEKAVVDGSGQPQTDLSQSEQGRLYFTSFRFANDAVASATESQVAVAIADTRRSQAIFFYLLLASAFLVGAILAGLGLMLTRSLVLPIAGLAVTARALARGDSVKAVASTRTDEVGDLSRALAAWQVASKDRDHFFTLSSDLLAIAGFDGVFKTINPAWEQVTGHSVAELTSKPYLEFVHADDRAATIAEAGKLAAGARTISFRNRYVCNDGSYKWLDWTAVPVQDEQLIYAVARDITRQKAAEEEIQALNTQLQQRIAERDATNKELESFSYSVSHDLRAPLRAVHGFVQILLQEHGQTLEADARRYLDLVAANAQQMGRLVDDLLQFSRMGRQPLNRQRLNMNAVAKRAVEQLQPALDGREVELTIGELPSAEGDPTLLNHVFVNLIDNAIKYTRGRQPALIEVGSTSNDAGEIVYFVKDNGTGFDMRYAHKLFGVFQRLHRSEEYEGTGVGLALVHRMITKHGGRIWPEASVGKGATFYFTLGGALDWPKAA
jgi:PAS domain S-box-containing protein